MTDIILHCIRRLFDWLLFALILTAAVCLLLIPIALLLKILGVL